MNDFSSREFPMSDQDFSVIAKKAYEVSGIVLGEHKKNMVYSRLSRRIRGLGFQSFGQYLSFIENNHEQELSDFINSLTTNLTSFFREQHHFDYLTKTVFPSWSAARSNRRKRIWSAGCSTGEEPYSIAMTCQEADLFRRFDLKILATDLDSNVLSKGKSGFYENDRLQEMEDRTKRKYFAPAQGGMVFTHEVKQSIQFNRLNLLGPWPMKGQFDVIFCRNVVIYFDKDTQKKLFQRFAQALTSRGYLFIGHSESLHRVNNEFESLGGTIYRKIN